MPIITKPIRVLILGLPGTPIFELGESLSEWQDIDYIVIEEGEDRKTYFEDKIESIDLDTDDYASGSNRSQGVRDIRSLSEEKKMDSVDVPEYGLLEQDEIDDIGDEEWGICSSEFPDERLVSWCTHLVLLDADTSAAIKWFSKRRKCYSCGAVFHTEDKPPRVSGICDRCGSDLKKKPTDNPNVINQVYKSWNRQFNRVRDKAKDVHYLRVRVDNARDFEHIFVTVNRWLEKTSKDRQDWTYKN